MPELAKALHEKLCELGFNSHRVGNTVTIRHKTVSVDIYFRLREFSMYIDFDLYGVYPYNY